jgi:superfamily II DNA/RNA helicase
LPALECNDILATASTGTGTGTGTGKTLSFLIPMIERMDIGKINARVLPQKHRDLLALEGRQAPWQIKGID